VNGIVVTTASKKLVYDWAMSFRVNTDGSLRIYPKGWGLNPRAFHPAGEWLAIQPHAVQPDERSKG
jgi:hypothetical protein